MGKTIMCQPTSNFTIDTYILDCLKNSRAVPKFIFNTRIKYTSLKLILDDILIPDLYNKIQPHDVAPTIDIISNIIRAAISRAILINGFSRAMLNHDALVIYRGCMLFIELELERYSLLTLCDVIDRDFDSILTLIKSILKDLVKQLLYVDNDFKEAYDMLACHDGNIYGNEFVMYRVYANEILSIVKF